MDSWSSEGALQGGLEERGEWTYSRYPSGCEEGRRLEQIRYVTHQTRIEVCDN